MGPPVEYMTPRIIIGCPLLFSFHYINSISTRASNLALCYNILHGKFLTEYRMSWRPVAITLQSRLYIPFLGIARPQSQFLHSCVCERFIHSQDRSTLHIFPPAETAAPSWEYIIRSQTHECGNWDWSPDIPFLGIFASNFWHFFFAVYQLLLLLPNIMAYARLLSSPYIVCALLFALYRNRR